MQQKAALSPSLALSMTSCSEFGSMSVRSGRDFLWVKALKRAKSNAETQGKYSDASEARFVKPKCLLNKGLGTWIGIKSV